MLFNSLSFLIFFPVVTIVYFLLPHRFRWAWLLAASCYFYMVFIPAYILILALLIVIDYFACIWIEQSQGRRRKALLLLSILSVCLALFMFKYFNFINSNLHALAGFLHWNYPIGTLRLILPLGLSFHTFQSLSCVIEVYKGRQKAERNFGIYALYVMFYPQLVAGPIERPQNLLHQFHEQHAFEYGRVVDGLKLMALGLFKKMVIADRLAFVVNRVYGSPRDYEGLGLVIATVFFAFQIYCDFSGYSDIAIGAAQVMGFRLMDNFDRPYASASISEFWRRWHISLSSWFRDYVYIPLGGSRVSEWRLYLNLMVTFLISGLWHGANWTFLIWGAINGLYVVMETASHDAREKLAGIIGLTRHRALRRAVSVPLTFALTCLAWVFFRARDVKDALYIVTHSFSGLGTSPRVLVAQAVSFVRVDGLSFYVRVALAILSLVALEVIYRAHGHGSPRHLLDGRPAFMRWAFYCTLVVVIVVFGVYSVDRNQEFIYFQF